MTKGAARRWTCAVAALALGTAALRWPYFDVPISADEGGYGTAAWWWARGDTLYQNITITRPQGIFVVFRLIDALGLASSRGVHLFATAWTVLCTLALLAVVGRIWGQAIGIASAALFALIMATPYLEGYSANAELFMLLPLLGSLWCLVRADEVPIAGRAGLALLAGSGALGALALLLKPSGVVALPLATLWLLRRRRVEQATWRRWFCAEAALGAGFVAGLAPAVVHGLLTAPDRYLDAVLLYRLGKDSLVAGTTDHQWLNLKTNSAFILARLPILLLAFPGFFIKPPVARNDDPAAARQLLWLWAATATAGTALGGNWFLHYYQQLLPPFAVATVLTLRALCRRATRPGWIVLQGLGVVGAIGLAMAIIPMLLRPAEPSALPEWEPGVSAAAPIAAYVQAHTAPGDTIYVAYDHADIYYLARRRPAARWLHFRELGWTPGAFGEQVARIADPATAPRYIVGAQAFDRWGFDPDGALRAVVSRDYVLETTIDGVALYRRPGQ